MDVQIKAASCLGLVTDGWTNVGDGIINFMVTTPKPLFYKYMDRGVNRETAVYVSFELIKVIDEVGSDKVLVVVSDRAPVMVAALRMVSDMYPHICGVGSSCHGLQNFLHDINELDPVRKIISGSKK